MSRGVQAEVVYPRENREEWRQTRAEEGKPREREGTESKKERKVARARTNDVCPHFLARKTRAVHWACHPSPRAFSSSSHSPYSPHQWLASCQRAQALGIAPAGQPSSSGLLSRSVSPYSTFPPSPTSLQDESRSQPPSPVSNGVSPDRAITTPHRTTSTNV